MSRYGGKQDNSGPKTVRDHQGVVISARPNKGVVKRTRTQKREEAEVRAETVEHDRTRAHRLGRCDSAQHLLVEIFTA